MPWENEWEGRFSSPAALSLPGTELEEMVGVLHGSPSSSPGVLCSFETSCLI